METTNSSKKFEEALHLLNEAAKDKKEEIQRLVMDKYDDIKETLSEVVTEKAEDLKNAKKIAKKKLEEGEEKVREVVSDVDAKIRKNPWPYVGGVALGALILGFLMGSSKKD